MGVNEIRSVIERSAPQLRAAGLSAIYLFGSQARGDSGEDSDIDLAFEVSDDSGFNLIDQGRLQVQLEELLQRRVDFVSRNGMRPKVRKRVEAEMVRLL